MNKRLASILLALVFLLGMLLPAYAAEADEPPAFSLRTLSISSAEDFLRLAEDCILDTYSIGLVVYLECDIDLSGLDFTGIPIFSGALLGNGHTISGLNITHDGSVQGLFRYLESAAVVDSLNISGTVSPSGSRCDVGAIAGRNKGTITNCTFTGSVSGADNVGGLVGVNSVSAIIENCHVEGSVNGSHFVGGIAGTNYGVVRSCSNIAQVNTTVQQNTVELSDITLDTLTNSEAINTVTDIGGIVGISSGVIRNCENYGDVGYQHMGYNIGGIAGTQSGYIIDCVNHADVRGRKETGGIVGQLEPVTVIEYSLDTLQILQGQLVTMSGLVDQASLNAQSNAGMVSGQINQLQDIAQSAQDSVGTLLPEDGEQPVLPDEDTLQAAQNSLTASMTALPQALNSLAYSTQNLVSGLTNDLEAISLQMNIIGATLNSASDNLGATITDVSDLDTPDLLTGKVEGCINRGSVLAELNAGGIAGAIAVENDLDILEDWDSLGQQSLNFDSQLRAVILNCSNEGLVTGTKYNAGGIVGWQSLGLVKGCTNTGNLSAVNADYAGGISGLSTGFIRECHSKCEISAASYAGGIAGSATIVTDCRSMTSITGATEKTGAVLGFAQEADSDDAKPVSGNLYMIALKDIGAIDGISYDGIAQGLEISAFLALDGLPQFFRTVTVRFLFEDGTEQSVAVVPGGRLDASKIPAVPDKDGYTGYWEGIEEADLSHIFSDLTFTAAYTTHRTVIQSEVTRNAGLPVLLVLGSFTDDAQAVVSRSDLAPELSEDEQLIEVWSLSVSGADRVTSARLLLPDAMEGERLMLFVLDDGGQWHRIDSSVDGSYLVFEWNGQAQTVALVRSTAIEWNWPYIISGALLLVIIFISVIRKLISRAKERKAAKTKAAGENTES